MEEIVSAIFLGAAEFALHAPFSNQAFGVSKSQFDDYLRKDIPRGLGLEAGLVLDLFDSTAGAGDQLKRIGSFVDRVKNRHPTAIRNLLIYYVGHGFFAGDEGNDYYLALASHDADFKDTTGLAVSSLGRLLKDRAKTFRTFYIFDCCFAGDALRSIMGDDDAASRLAAAALHNEAPRGQSELPKRGSALLCAASKDAVARAPKNLPCTVFSSALLKVLKSGDPGGSSNFSLAEIKEMVWEQIQKDHRDNKEYQVRPAVHAPDQCDGDISTKVRFFPNAAYSPKEEKHDVLRPLATDSLASDQQSRSTGDSFDRLIDNLRGQLSIDGVFYTDVEHSYPTAVRKVDELATESYLLRLFTQKLLYASTKMHARTAGSANVWVCHKERKNANGTAEPSFLRSGEREGPFDIDQLVMRHGNIVYFRTNAVSYDPAKFETLSVAAQAIVAGSPKFQQVLLAKYDSRAESKIGITHILGLPLFKSEEVDGSLIGVPMVMTVDFQFRTALTTKDREEIDRACTTLADVFHQFKSIWSGTKSFLSVPQPTS